MNGERGFALPALLLRAAQIGIGAVFIVAAVAKIADPTDLALQAKNFRLLPVGSEHLVAITLPWIELLAGAALVTGLRARAGALLTLLMMAVFTVAVGSAWARGLDFRCGCFGKASASSVGPQKFFENVGLTLLAAVALLPPRRKS